MLSDFSNNLLNWLYQDSGYIAWIRRLTGACLAYSWIFQLLYIVPAPYFVPSWRLGNFCLNLPSTPATFDHACWLAAFAGAILLILGTTSKLLIATTDLIFAYYGSRELMFLNPSFNQLLLTYLIALLFYKQPASLTRRLIQLSVSCCYFFSALGKLHPEFIEGHTFWQMVQHGWGLRPFLVPYVLALHLPFALMPWLSASLVAVELFLSLALYFQATRKFALGLGILLHVSIIICLPGVEIFSPIILIGYLAFFDQQSKQQAPPSTEIAAESSPPAAPGTPLSSARRSGLELPLALAFAAMMIGLPLRFYAFPQKPLYLLTFFDRSPWSFSMYLFEQKVKAVSVSILGPDGRWLGLPLEGRMWQCSSDNELITLAAYTLSKHPEAKAVKIESVIEINHHCQQRKLCTSTVGPGGPTVELQYQSLRDGKPWY